MHIALMRLIYTDLDEKLEVDIIRLGSRALGLLALPSCFQIDPLRTSLKFTETRSVSVEGENMCSDEGARQRERKPLLVPLRLLASSVLPCAPTAVLRESCGGAQTGLGFQDLILPKGKIRPDPTRPDPPFIGFSRGVLQSKLHKSHIKFCKLFYLV